MASHPFAHALFTHRWPGLQSLEAMHATQAVWPLHFCPVGQSASTPQSTQLPPRHTWPVVLVLQSAFVVHPVLGPDSFAASVGPLVASSPDEASWPLPWTRPADPPPHPEGRAITTSTETIHAEKANEANFCTIKTI